MPEGGRRVRASFEAATADNLRSLLTRGVFNALHFSGHGVPHALAFEDGHGQAHFIELAMLKRLMAAGSGTASAVAIATDASVVNPRQCVLVDLDGDHRALRSERGVFTIQARAAGDCIVELELADVSLVAEAGLDASLEPLVVDVPPRVVGGGGGGDLD